MSEIKDIKLSQILPESIAKDANVKAASEAFDSKLQAVSREVDIPLIYFRLNELSSEQLDHIAYAWDASVWRESWTLEIKRNVLNNVIREKRKRGTLGAVKAAIETIGSVTEIKEWWQENPKGIPHTFKVTARLNHYAGVLDSELQEDLFALIDDAKPARSHYEFILSTRLSGKFSACGVFRKLAYARVKQGVLTNEQTEATISVNAAARPMIIRNILATAKN
jgi:phage tail P2-like protein